MVWPLKSWDVAWVSMDSGAWSGGPGEWRMVFENANEACFLDSGGTGKRESALVFKKQIRD